MVMLHSSTVSPLFLGKHSFLNFPVFAGTQSYSGVEKLSNVLEGAGIKGPPNGDALTDYAAIVES